MAGEIFINYRRDDDPGFTQALYHRLESEFGRDALFMDVEGYMKAGDDFVEVLGAQVAQSSVLLVVIGPRWLEVSDEQGCRRLDNPDDFVRIEIASALEHKKRVIPVLVNNAAMPRADELPEPLKPLTRRNAVRLTVERFGADCAGLVKDLRDVIGGLQTTRRSDSGAKQRPRPLPQSSGVHRADPHADPYYAPASPYLAPPFPYPAPTPLPYPAPAPAPQSVFAVRTLPQSPTSNKAKSEVGLSARPTPSAEGASRAPMSALQESIGRIHGASQVPPLSPPEYRVLFEVIAEEINVNGLNGDETRANILQRSRQIGLELNRDDLHFVLKVVSEADPSFKRGVSAQKFARRFRNFVVTQCRGKGMRLSAEEIGLIDAWFGTSH